MACKTHGGLIRPKGSERQRSGAERQRTRSGGGVVLICFHSGSGASTAVRLGG